MACDCWTEDVWRYVHSMAQTNAATTLKEKEAFVCMVACINELISCEEVKLAVDTFMRENPFVNHCSSSDTIFMWTVNLRQAVDEKLGKPVLTLSHLSDVFARNKIGKDVWGPMAWKVMHMVALCAKTVPVPGGKPELPRSTRTALKAFVTCVLLLLPCPKCKKHAWEYCQKVAPNIDDYLTTNLHAFQWTVEFHNTVNRRLNSTEGHRKPILSANDALGLYVTLPPNADFSSSFKPMRLD